MACQLELPLWPSNIDCLSWSKDNLIAVAGGPEVAILLPRITDPGPNRTLWDNTIFKVNAFTAEEIPLSNLLGFKNFSAGEEISQRHIQSLAWSSPGLGKHGRCVLAVLTSDHVLSIWECQGKLDVFGDWKRTVIINHALKDYYKVRLTEHGEPKRDLAGRLQVSQRVRAFAWSDPVYCEFGQAKLSTPYTDHGRQLLAVATEAGDIFLLRVASPNDVLDTNIFGWRIGIANCFSLTHFIAAESSTPKDSDKNPICDTLTWSHFNSEDGDERSKLAFVSRGRLYYVTITANAASDGVRSVLADSKATRLVPTIDNLTVPLRFVPHTDSLVLFGPDTVYHVSISMQGAANRSMEHDLDGRWDEVSGIAFTNGRDRTKTLHFSSILIKPEASTAVLQLPFDKSQPAGIPTWVRALANTRTAFSDQHKLHVKVLSRVWGIAASPMGDLVATATTLLPSEYPSYVTPSEYRTTINITHEQSDGEILPVDRGFARTSDLTPATLLFACKAHKERNDDPLDTDALVEAMSRSFAVPDDQINYDPEFPAGQAIEPLQYARRLRLRLFLIPEMRIARFRLLAGMMMEETYSASSITQTVVQRLVDEVLKLPAQLHEVGQLSTQIHNAYQALGQKLQARSRGSNEYVSAFEESCRICEAKIFFESIKWARCDSGHQFGRCGLTFLAMQEPGISKQCGICKTRFFDEWSLPALRRSKVDGDVKMSDVHNEVNPRHDGKRADNVEQEEDGILNERADASTDAGWVLVKSSKPEPKQSLARILFAAFDRCVYCGGNF